MFIVGTMGCIFVTSVMVCVARARLQYTLCLGFFGFVVFSLAGIRCVLVCLHVKHLPRHISPHISAHFSETHISTQFLTHISAPIALH